MSIGFKFRGAIDKLPSTSQMGDVWYLRPESKLILYDGTRYVQTGVADVNDCASMFRQSLNHSLDSGNIERAKKIIKEAKENGFQYKDGDFWSGSDPS